MAATSLVSCTFAPRTLCWATKRFHSGYMAGVSGSSVKKLARVFDFAQGEVNRKTESVAFQSARRDVPEFRDVLKREMQCLALAEQDRDAFDGCEVVLMVRLGSAQKDIPVDKNARLAT